MSFASNQVKRNEWSTYAPTRRVQRYRYKTVQTIAAGQLLLMTNWSPTDNVPQYPSMTFGAGAFTVNETGVYSITVQLSFNRVVGVDSTQGLFVTVNEGADTNNRLGDIRVRSLDPEAGDYTCLSTTVVLGLEKGDLVRTYAHNEVGTFQMSATDPYATKIRFERLY